MTAEERSAVPKPGPLRRERWFQSRRSAYSWEQDGLDHSTRLDALAEDAGPKAVLFLHNAGLLARYYDGGGHDLLVGAQQAARRPTQAPHGLWLLCPMEDPKQTPTLDGRTVGVVDRATEWVLLDSLFLKEVREERSSEGTSVTSSVAD